MTVDVCKRKFLLGTFALGVCLPITGCAPLLMRLVVGRVAATALSRAALGGGARASMTFGRGIGISHNTIRSSSGVRSLPKTRIVRKDGKPVAQTVEESNGTAVYSSGSRVFYSAKKDLRHTHIDVNSGHVGYSVPVRNNAVALQDRQGRVISYDKVRTAKQVIEHYDSEENLTGETGFSTTNDTMILKPDMSVITDIEQLSELLGLDCPETKEAYDEYIRQRSNCDAGIPGSCSRATFSHSRYELLKERCFKSR